MNWKSRRKLRRVAVLATQLLIVAGVLLFWEIGSRRGWMDRLAWSRPSSIWPRITSTISSDTFLQDFRATTTSMGAGFIIGVVIGFVIGTAVWRVKALRGAAEHGLMTLQALPLMIFYPLLLAVFGLTRTPMIILVAAGVVIPVALNVSLGLESVPPNLEKLGRSLRWGPMSTFWKIRLPAAMPLIFPGVQLGFIYTVVGTIGMEFILASKGLGFRVGASYRQFQPDQMYADIVLVCCLAVLLSAMVRLVGRNLKGVEVR